MTTAELELNPPLPRDNERINAEVDAEIAANPQRYQDNLALAQGDPVRAARKLMHQTMRIRRLKDDLAAYRADNTDRMQPYYEMRDKIVAQQLALPEHADLKALLKKQFLDIPDHRMSPRLKVIEHNKAATLLLGQKGVDVRELTKKALTEKRQQERGGGAPGVTSGESTKSDVKPPKIPKGQRV
jgi:hypothetical protein